LSATQAVGRILCLVSFLLSSTSLDFHLVCIQPKIAVNELKRVESQIFKCVGDTYGGVAKKKKQCYDTQEISLRYVANVELFH
jgi:hypothetical protein